MKVLLATDGSNNSQLTNKLVKRLHSLSAFEVHVLSVASLPVPNGVPEFDFGIDLAKAANEQSNDAVRRTCEELSAAGIQSTGNVMEGQPAAAIIDEAARLNVDLIIVGAQGHSLLERLLLGSVSDFVATHASCSVLVVRETPALTNANVPLKICIGYDDSEPYRRSLDFLAKSGWSAGAEVELVHAVAMPVDNFTDIPIQFDPMEVIAANEAMVERAASAASEALSAEVTGHVEQGTHVGFALTDYVEREKSDLLVVGDTGRGVMARFFLGSVSRNVLRHAAASVLIVRAHKK